MIDATVAAPRITSALRMLWITAQQPLGIIPSGGCLVDVFGVGWEPPTCKPCLRRTRPRPDAPARPPEPGSGLVETLSPPRIPPREHLGHAVRRRGDRR